MVSCAEVDGSFHGRFHNFHVSRLGFGKAGGRFHGNCGSLRGSDESFHGSCGSFQRRFNFHGSWKLPWKFTGESFRGSVMEVSKEASTGSEELYLLRLASTNFVDFHNVFKFHPFPPTPTNFHTFECTSTSTGTSLLKLNMDQILVRHGSMRAPPVDGSFKHAPCIGEPFRHAPPVDVLQSFSHFRASFHYF